MTRNHYFQFKQFRIEQGECAMKVTTDACLQGALFGEAENTRSSKRILDIGTGTGLLSLMAAQNSNAYITAVELDPSAAQQATFNFNASLWAHRMTVINQSIQDFAQATNAESIDRFDSIITNPPFYQQAFKGNNQQRNMARHTDNLSFEALTTAIATLLHANGECWILLPVDFSKYLLQASLQTSLKLIKIIKIRSSDAHPVHRHILVLGQRNNENDIKSVLVKEEMLTIYNEHPTYTSDVQKLMKPYYLTL